MCVLTHFEVEPPKSLCVRNNTYSGFMPFHSPERWSLIPGPWTQDSAPKGAHGAGVLDHERVPNVECCSLETLKPFTGHMDSAPRR